MIALTAAASVSEANTPATPVAVSSGALRDTNRRSSAAPITTSSRLPKLWPTAAPTGNAE